MKKFYRIGFLGLSTVTVLMLVGCGQKTNTNTNVSDNGTTIETVNNAGKVVKGNGELDVSNKETKETAKGSSEQIKQLSETEIRKQQEQIRRNITTQAEEAIKKIQKGQIDPQTVNALQNAYYNKHLLSKEEQKKIEQAINKVKKAKAEAIIKQVQISKVLPEKYKKQIVDLIKKKYQKGNLTDITDIQQTANMVDNYIRMVKLYKKEGTKAFRERIIQSIKQMQAQTQQATLEKLSQAVSQIQLSDVLKEVIKVDQETKQAVIKILSKRVKESFKQAKTKAKNTIFTLTPIDINAIINLAKNPNNIKLKILNMVNDIAIEFAPIPYVVYKGKPVSLEFIYRMQNVANTLQKVGLKPVFYMSTDPKTGLYTPINLYKLKKTASYAIGYLLAKNNSGFIDLIASIYKVKSPEDIANSVTNFVEGSYVDYTNIKDYDKFNKLVQQLNAINFF